MGKFIALPIQLVGFFFFKPPKAVDIPKKHAVSPGESEVKFWNSHSESAASFSRESGNRELRVSCLV